MREPSLNELLEVAQDAAYEAGNYSLPYFGKPATITHKGAIDIVTEVDVACENLIRKKIAAAYPGHSFYGEESGDPSLKNAEYLWVVDPIDGTTNFAHGYPHYAVSIGFRHNGETLVAAVFEPLTGAMYTATADEDAKKNGTPMRVSVTDALIRSLLITGFYYDVVEEGAVDNLAEFGRALKKARAIRRDGSAVLDLCHVAEGIVDGFWEHSLQPWDVCAGNLIVERAHGVVTGLEHEPYDIFSRRFIIATNGRIHDELCATLKGEPFPT